MTDRELFSAWQRHPTSELFAQLVARHINFVFAIARRHLRHAHAAEDVTQEVFLLLSRKGRTLTPDTPLAAWLFTTTRLTCLQAQRAQARRHRHEQEAAMSHLPLSPPDPTWSLIAGDVDAAVADLPANDRDALLLRYFSGKSTPEIAADLAISEEAAKKRVQRALESLRELLALRGFALPAVALAAALAANATAQAAPVALTVTITTAAAKSAALTGGKLLMATTQIKIAAAAVAVLAVGIPVALVTNHYLHPTAPTPPSVAAVLPAADELLYMLPDDQFIARLENPSPEARAAFFARYYPKDRDERRYIHITWEGNAPVLGGDDNGIPLHEILCVFMHLYPQQIDFRAQVPPGLVTAAHPLDSSAVFPVIPGDMLFRAGGTPEQYAQALTPLLSQALGHPVQVTLQNITQPAIILRGSWHNPAATVPNSPELPLVEIFGSARSDTPIRYNVTRENFADTLGTWLRQPVILEAEGFPPRAKGHTSAVALQFHDLKDSSAARDKTLVLKNLADQTGLTWTEEVRPITRLVITSADPFQLAYGLAPGQLIKRVTDPPAAVRQAFIDKNFSASPPPGAPAIHNETAGVLHIGWNGDQRSFTGMIHARRIALQQLLRPMFNLRDIEIEGDFRNGTITGDIAFDQAAPPEKRAIALEKFLADELNLRAKVRYAIVPRNVIVLKGKWKFFPIAGTPDTNRPTSNNIPVPSVDLFDTIDFPANSSQVGSGFGPIVLEHWFNEQVIIEADDVPSDFAIRLFVPQINGGGAYTQVRDKPLTFKHLEEQTGLIATEETRNVPRLILERAP